MSLIKAQQILYKVSSLLELQKEVFSHEEITKKINQIKYLAAQKKTPRFVLKKEILALEDELKDMLDLEKSLNKSRQQESTNVKLLKKKVELLKKRLAIAEDKDLTKKVERLSHLLGETLAKCGTAEEVEQLKGILAEVSPKRILKRTSVRRNLIEPSQIPVSRTLSEADKTKLQLLLDRLTALKHELEMEKILKKRNNLQLVEKSIQDLESKLNKLLLLQKELEPVSTTTQTLPEEEVALPSNIKHDIMFGTIQNLPSETTFSLGGAQAFQVSSSSFNLPSDAQLEAELPLPPPPRMKG
ncbi:MAG: hypothetical protein WCV90_00015 [Candidatus Woesearchaeota archaeon]|jgi:hypothetical protein